ncbi:hypothetical protein KR018_001127 [Drosophila ironensis]|nr:hypothetical protein KR018_001127 [Drosophila ironensis]
MSPKSPKSSKAKKQEKTTSPYQGNALGDLARSKIALNKVIKEQKRLRQGQSAPMMQQKPDFPTQGRELEDLIEELFGNKVPLTVSQLDLREKLVEFLVTQLEKEDNADSSSESGDDDDDDDSDD